MGYCSVQRDQEDNTLLDHDDHLHLCLENGYSNSKVIEAT